MPYPTLPAEGYWNNPDTHQANFTKTELQIGGVIQRTRSHLLNNTRQSWAFQGVLQNRQEVDDFLRDRDGMPFEFQGREWTCVQWTWTWIVYVSPDGTGKTIDPSGVWELSATFTQNHNPDLGR